MGRVELKQTTATKLATRPNEAENERVAEKDLADGTRLADIGQRWVSRAGAITGSAIPRVLGIRS
jgi:hypothetical protein